MLDHDREEIISAEPKPDGLGIDLVHQGIVPPNHQPLDWRIEVRRGQDLAKLTPVEASRSLRRKFRALGRIVVEGWIALDRQSAAGQSPVAR